MKNKVIISCSIIGAIPTRENSPYIPLTPEEIADSAIEAANAGAAIVHLHARNKNGHPTCDFDVFKKIVDRIRAHSDVVINLTSSTTHDATDYTRMKPFIELKPEIASFDCGTMNSLVFTFENTIEFLKRNAAEMKKAGVRPEIECFDTPMVHSARRFQEENVLDDHLMLACVLGVPGGSRASVRNLHHMVKAMPEGSNWTGFGIGGRASVPMMYASLAMGGHLRIGMEDNVYLSKGVLAESNAQLVEKAVRIVKNFGNEIATPDEAREILHLRKRDQDER